MSARAVTERSAVLRAIEECAALGREAFLERYGFARSTQYELVHEGKPYDPPAIVAVAHREQHGSLLGPTEMKGILGVLRALGFEIVDHKPPWREEEMVLALEVYLRHRGKRLGKTNAEVIELSATLRRLGSLSGETPWEVFRNATGVEQHLGNFLDLDELATIKGRGQPSALHREIWERYAGKPLALSRRAAEIRSALDGHRRTGTPNPKPGSDEMHDARRPRKKLSREELSSPFEPELEPPPAKPAAQSQMDAEALRRAKATHRSMRLQIVRFFGTHGFTSRNPPTGRSDLRYDLLLVRKTLTLLIEVKSLPPSGDDQDQLRPGLGQILWYRGRWREDCDDPCVAVLFVEREPADAATWLSVCSSAGVVLTWPERFEVLIEECGRIAAPSGVTYRR